jgi:HAMP domain-containing protein
LTTDVVRPVEILQRAAKHLIEGALDHRIDLETSARTNELGELADAFNDMASALDASAQPTARPPIRWRSGCSRHLRSLSRLPRSDSGRGERRRERHAA